MPYRCSVLGGKGCENQGVWPDTSSASFPSLPLCLLSLPRHFWKVFHCWVFFVCQLGVLSKERELWMESKRSWRSYIMEVVAFEIWPSSFLTCLLACFAVNKKKPEGEVPSKHLNDCLEYGFLN